jgi:predicted small lipoprotein YifL
MSRHLIVALAVVLALALGACGKKGDLDAPPGADPALSKDVFKKPR